MRSTNHFLRNAGYTSPVVELGQRIEKSGRLRSTGPGMAHEIAKLLLEHAGTFLERTEAIKSAVALGMPLNAIEEYLDWLDQMRSSPAKNPPAKSPDVPGKSG